MDKNIIITTVCFMFSLIFTIMFSVMDILLLTLLWGVIAIIQILLFSAVILNYVKGEKDE